MMLVRYLEIFGLEMDNAVDEMWRRLEAFATADLKESIVVRLEELEKVYMRPIAL